MSQPSVEQMEQYVRERWEFITIQQADGRSGYECYGSVAAGGETRDEIVRNLYQKTQRREQEIREKREEIVYMQNPTLVLAPTGYEAAFNAIRGRIIATLEAQLADLLEGFREQ